MNDHENPPVRETKHHPPERPESSADQREWRAPRSDEFPPRTPRHRGLRRFMHWTLFDNNYKLEKAPVLPRDREDDEPRDLTLRQSFFIMLFVHVGVISGILHFRFWESMIRALLELLSKYADGLNRLLNP